MHTEISQVAWAIWIVIIAGELIVFVRAAKTKNVGLSIFLAVEILISAGMVPMARLASGVAYYRAYVAAQGLHYVAETVLLASIFISVRKTGIPGKNHPSLIRWVAFLLFGFAIYTLGFPLRYISNSNFKWLFSTDHVFNYWLCLMLVVAPFYAWLVDSAKDTRLLLVYIGFSLYVVVNAGVLDFAISSHLAKVRSVLHLPDFAYIASLFLWFLSCRYQFAAHQWDTAQTESLKAALRSKRSHVNALSRSERVRKS